VLRSKIITRKEAIALGLSRYFTGKPCKRGHVTERCVGNALCIECAYQLSHQWRIENSERAHAFRREWQMGQHAARIKIAVDPPDTLTLGGKTATMTIHDYKVTGADVPSKVIKQAEAFIEQNRDVLMQFWNGEIDTPDMIEQIRRPSGA
jgi:hypothetical protein